MRRSASVTLSGALIALVALIALAVVSDVLATAPNPVLVLGSGSIEEGGMCAVLKVPTGLPNAGFDGIKCWGYNYYDQFARDYCRIADPIIGQRSTALVPGLRVLTVGTSLGVSLGASLGAPTRRCSRRISRCTGSAHLSANLVTPRRRGRRILDTGLTPTSAGSRPLAPRPSLSHFESPSTPVAPSLISAGRDHTGFGDRLGATSRRRTM